MQTLTVTDHESPFFGKRLTTGPRGARTQEVLKWLLNDGTEATILIDDSYLQCFVAGDHIEYPSLPGFIALLGAYRARE